MIIDKCKNLELETLNFNFSNDTICPEAMADEFGLVEKSKIMDSARMERALSRLASEIVEENHGADGLYIVGIRRRGVPLAERIAEKIQRLEGEKPLYG